MLASLLCPGYFRTSSSINKFLMLVVHPSSLLILSTQSSLKSPLAKPPMLSWPPNPLTPSSPLQFPPNSQECSQETLIQGCDKEDKAIAYCNPQEGVLGFCFEVPGMDCGELFGLMRLKSTGWDQMGSSGCGNRWESVRATLMTKP